MIGWSFSFLFIPLFASTLQYYPFPIDFFIINEYFGGTKGVGNGYYGGLYEKIRKVRGYVHDRPVREENANGKYGKYLIWTIIHNPISRGTDM